VTSRNGWIKRGAALLLLLLVFACTPARTPQAPAAPPILVLVSLDGWRWDYLDRANAPHLKALAARGVRSQGLRPAFPSKTFPNHYTIVTGLYPSSHGIVSNNIWDDTIGQRFTMSAETAKDPRWWGGEPLWVTAIRQGRRASSMFWPGSEVAFGGIRPTDWTPYDDDYPYGDRVKQVLGWLARPEAERPSFVTLYFSAVDSAGHDYGPDDARTIAIAEGLDAHMGSLIDGIDALGLTDRTTIMAVSDHGMSALAPERRIFIDDYIDVQTINIVDWSPVLQISPKTGTTDDVYRALRGRHPSLDVYTREDLPRALHFSGHPRITPIVALAADGWAITTRERFAQSQKDGRVMKGDHGYDGRLKSMHGLFIAAGPRLRRGVVVPPFDNVHLYELMCRLLNLKPARNDGDPAVTRRFLR
jgi:predicted AlkP superfamily pyrophosphatase or phosphodiesterase